MKLIDSYVQITIVFMKFLLYLLCVNIVKNIQS